MPLALDSAPDRIGPLRFLGGVQLQSANPRLGGISGLLVDDALSLTAVTDTGLWVTARIDMADDRLVGVRDLELFPIRDGAGQPLPRGAMADAESLTRLPDGSLLVGFERWHRIRRFARPDAPGDFFPAPPGLETASGNAALESLTLLEAGRLLAIEEGTDETGAPRRAWLGGAERWTTLAYRPAELFRPTDAAGLPGGGALVLERSFSMLRGFGSRITHLSRRQLEAAGPGTVLEPVEIGRIVPPLTTENFEGIAVARRPAGGLYVFLVSDDNFNALQRTLLFAFMLEAGALEGALP